MYAIQTVAGFSLDCLGKRQVGSHDHIHFQLDLQWSSNHNNDLCRLPHYFVSVLWGSAVAITWRFAITPVQLCLWLSPAWPCLALRQYPRDYMWLMITDLWVGVDTQSQTYQCSITGNGRGSTLPQQLVSEKKNTLKKQIQSLALKSWGVWWQLSHMVDASVLNRRDTWLDASLCLTAVPLAAAPAAAICFGGANFQMKRHKS